MTSLRSNFRSPTERVEWLFKVWSGFYDHPVPQRVFYGRVHRILLRVLAGLKPENILDAGCGTGELFHKVSRQWPDAALVGLDLSREMLNVAESKTYQNADVSFIEASVYDIPLPDEQFDLVTNNISSHFYMDFDKALGEFARVLKPGGILAMASITNGGLAFLPGPFRKQLRMRDAVFRGAPFQKKELSRKGFHVEKVLWLPFNARLFIARKI